MLSALRVATLACILWCPATVAQQDDLKVSWKQLNPGLETSQIALHYGTMFSSSIVLVRSDSSYSLRAIRASQFGWNRASVKALCKAAGADACINANFFDEQGRPLGLVVSRGIIYNKMHHGGGTLTGVLYSTDNETRIVHRDSFSFSGAVEAIQAGPRLISNGKPIEGIKDSSSSSNLSGVCLDADHRLILFRVNAGVFGGSLNGLQKNLLRPEIGCVDALNFDGGGSSQLFISAETTSLESDENLSDEDDIPVALGFFKKALDSK
jgi:exopolysaccharide biosynthesis protein